MKLAEQKKKQGKEIHPSVAKELKKACECERDYNDGAVETGKKNRIHCLSIIGQIEGHYILPDGQKATKYEQLIPELVDIEEDDEIEGLLIILNTMGGDVEAGMAIAEMIASMKKPSVSLVLGGGHSIGVPLATAAKKSFIVSSATMTLHPVILQAVKSVATAANISKNFFITFLFLIVYNCVKVLSFFLGSLGSLRNLRINSKFFNFPNYSNFTTN